MNVFINYNLTGDDVEVHLTGNYKKLSLKYLGDGIYQLQFNQNKG